SVSRRDLRRRSHVCEHRGVVARNPGGGPASQGPALLSPARGERADHVRRLRLRTEPAARRIGEARAPPAGRGGVRGAARRSLHPAQPPAPLTPLLSLRAWYGGLTSSFARPSNPGDGMTGIAA